MNISIITLGCSKNIVDSEKLAGILNNYNYNITFESLENADIAIVNTCGFILDAKEESIDVILNCARVKNDKRYKLKKLYVFGCLVELNLVELKEEIPEVDAWFGANDYELLAKSITKDIKKNNDNEAQRIISTPNHYAYLKVAEGCNKKCSFCAIPLIRGKHISRPKEEILEEAKFLYEKGVKELILISQDLTYYGQDIYKSKELSNLTKQISEIGFDWIRLHYAHPNEVNDDILKMSSKIPNLCRYFDIPLQHISTRILKDMKRNIDKEGTIALVKRLRDNIPDIIIRTTFIVGYPGETEEEFEELIEFVENMHFDRLGVFTFSKEKGTDADKLVDDVPEDVKISRMERLLEVQQEISLKNNQKRIGQVLKVLIDSQENGYYIARTEFDSPEVDNNVVISPDKELKIGEFYNALITDADYFDLIAVIPDDIN